MTRADQEIPEEPEGSPPVVGDERDEGRVPPLADLPAKDFWEALYERRSVRRFRPDPVPRELVDQVMHAGIWAPSSCNYQMWDLVAVDDPEVNDRLAALSRQMGNAPVNIVVAYGRDFSAENLANVQSASALIQNMGLAAQVLGLGTFWITQTGDADRVGQIVGLPPDRMVVAVLALGYPAIRPRKGPRRRPLSQVAHYNHYSGRPIPASPDPEAWEPDLLATYQRARVLNGLRHNKPRPWEEAALVGCLDVLVPEGRQAGAQGAPSPRWLDVLPCTGIVTERLGRERAGFAFDVVERTREVAAFVAGRLGPGARTFGWPAPEPGLPAPPESAYEVVSCFYRLEDLRAADRTALVAAMARWVKPGGRLILGFVSARSFHDTAEALRARRGGPAGVEYVLSPDPNIGPFRALEPRAVEEALGAAGLTVTGRLALQAAPPPQEVEFRGRNFGPRSRTLVRGMGWVLRALEHLPGVRGRYARFRYLSARRPD